MVDAWLAPCQTLLALFPFTVKDIGSVYLLIQGRIKALRGPRPIPNSSGGYIHTGVAKKLAIFDGNRRLSLKRCEIGQVTIQNIFHSFRETDYSYAYTFL